VKGILTLTVAALALSSMAQARSNWIRRLSAAAVCAASGADLATTAIGTAQTTRIPSYLVVPVNFGFAIPKFAAVGQNINQLQNMK
jgi:hypothetical protein